MYEQPGCPLGTRGFPDPPYDGGGYVCFFTLDSIYLLRIVNPNKPGQGRIFAIASEDTGTLPPLLQITMRQKLLMLENKKAQVKAGGFKLGLSGAV
jgi:hypothetical protein